MEGYGSMQDYQLLVLEGGGSDIFQHFCTVEILGRENQPHG